jgi:hypothetical protein
MLKFINIINTQTFIPIIRLYILYYMYIMYIYLLKCYGAGKG